VPAQGPTGTPAARTGARASRRTGPQAPQQQPPVHGRGADRRARSRHGRVGRRAHGRNHRGMGGAPTGAPGRDTGGADVAPTGTATGAWVARRPARPVTTRAGRTSRRPAQPPGHGCRADRRARSRHGRCGRRAHRRINRGIGAAPTGAPGTRMGWMSRPRAQLPAHECRADRWTCSSHGRGRRCAHWRKNRRMAAAPTGALGRDTDGADVVPTGAPTDALAPRRPARAVARQPTGETTPAPLSLSTPGFQGFAQAGHSRAPMFVPSMREGRGRHPPLPDACALRWLVRFWPP